MEDVLDLIRILEDYGIVVPHPGKIERMTLENELERWLDRLTDGAYDRGYDDGYDKGHEVGMGY